MRYETHYVHKIAPKDTDVGNPVDLSPTDLESKGKLAAALRKARVLSSGDKINSYRIETDRIVVFPQASIWHSIILHLPGTAALPPKKTGPDTYKHFTYKPPMSSREPMKRFRSSTPVTWTEARDRLIAAGIIDNARSGWSLSVDKSDYIDRLAEELP
jgi:hypothetical protein